MPWEDFFGPPALLDPQELPTLKNVLNFAKYCQQEFHGLKCLKLSSPQIVNQVYSEVMTIYKSASKYFEEPIIKPEKSLKKLIQKELERASKYSLGKGSAYLRSEFVAKADSLFDVFSCKCPIHLCTELCCELTGVLPVPCSPLTKYHYKCKCPPETTLPGGLLLFIRSQRDKSSGVPSTLKVADAQKVIIHDLKRAVEEEKQRKKQKLDEEEMDQEADIRDFLNELQDSGACDVDAMISDYYPSSDEETSDEESDEQSKSSVRKYNRVDIRAIALMAIRYKISNRGAAAIASATLVSYGKVTPDDLHLLIDEHKVARAREKVMNEFIEARDSIAGDIVTGIYFDAKGVRPLAQKLFGKKKVKFMSREVEDQYVVTMEPQSQYLFTFTVTEEATKEKPYAQIVAEKLLEGCEMHGVKIEKVQVFGCDTENTNTGWRAGVLAFVEQQLHRRVGTAPCMLHLNELPFRTVFTTLDGKSASGDKWTGPVGKLLNDAANNEKFPFNPEFEVVTDGIPLVEIRPEVLKDLSQDQKFLYEITKMVKTGIVPPNLIHRTLGALSGARWLTLASHVLSLWIRKHSLPTDVVDKFREIVRFIVNIYVPQWFLIKSNPLWTEAPKHYFSLLQKVRDWHSCESPKFPCPMKKNEKTKLFECLVKSKMEYNIQHNSYYFMDENILLHLISSKNQDDRLKAIDLITAIRENSDNPSLGCDNVRSRKLQNVNMSAETLDQVIDKFCYEPSLTCQISTSELRKYRDRPLSVAPYPCHTQSVERSIRTMTAAGQVVSTERRRDGVILTQQVACSLMSNNNSKQDMVNIVKANSISYSDTVKQVPQIE